MPPLTPTSIFESLIIGKETTFGTLGTLSQAHAFLDFVPSPKNFPIPRGGANRGGGLGMVIPGTGPFEATASLEVESQPDAIGQLFAYALGAQTTPTLNVVATTVGTGGSTSGATAVPVTSPINIVSGMQLTIDTGANVETLTVANPAISMTAGVASVNFTAATAHSHAAGVVVTCTSTTAYYTKMNLGPLPTLSMELNRANIDCIDYLGAIIDSMSISVKSKGGLSPKFTLCYRQEAVQASPTTPNFSPKMPLQFENGFNQQRFNNTVVGNLGQLATLGFDLTLSNNIDKTYYSGTSARLVQSWPQLRRNVKGTLHLGFENNTAYLAFLGAATLPAVANVPPFPVDWVMLGTDLIDVAKGIPYMVTFHLPNVYPSGDVVSNKGTLTQTLSFEASDSAMTNNDDLVIHYVGTNSTIF